MSGGGIVVRPLRFSADVPSMRELLERLGLRSRIESERGGWVDLVAGRGMVALHDAASSVTGGQSGQTNIGFEADDIDGLEDRLEAAGYADVAVWDEAYGRVLSFTGPDSVQLWIDERSQDLYGYKLNDAEPDVRWSVTPYLTGATEDAWRRLLEVLGCDQLLRFGPSGGEFGVRLDLTTTEDLAEVRRRVRHPVTESAEGLEIVDPDGAVIRIRR